MKKKLLIFITLVIFTLGLIVISPLAYSQTKGQSGDKIDGFPVVLNDSKLFIIQKGVGSFTAQERAETISKRLEKIAQDSSITIDKFTVEQQPDATNIVVNNKVLLTITQKDARAAREPELELAEHYLEILKNAVEQYRKERTPAYIILALVHSIIATLLIVVVFWAINLLSPRLQTLINSWREEHIPPLRFQNLELISAQKMTDIIISFIKFIRSLIFLSLIFIYIPFVFSFFPLTRPFGQRFISYFFRAIQLIVDSFIGYFPNVFIIAVVAITTFYTNRFLNFIFDEIERGNISFPGFYQDWARPTYNILRFLVIALAAVFVFPYLPGSNSPAFQGISVFLGILFSLGSTSAVANTVGGIILIYTRAFQIGDRVKIGEIIGDIEEKTLLVTRIRTPKNVLVTLPNSTLLSSNIINFSASARETKIPLVLNTTITLGYDAPWRKVHETLIQAAKATKHILENPAPFVLQTALNDFYVSYELNAYTHTTRGLDQIYSELHQNIQDKCNEADIEIMSPQYTALRDGNHTTIPANYLPQDYTAPGFHIESDNHSSKNS
ncbi:mechanosensitive ion channel family protein [Gloeothece verrucosa]|nr:mechanosensitive ion channel family protein [Gloeothece verrucosa]